MRNVGYLPNGTIGMVEVPNIIINQPCVISIDPSTSRTGVGVVSMDKQILGSMAIERENNETAIQFKVRYKQFIGRILNENKLISRVSFEEPYFDYIDTAKILFSLRTSIEELQEEMRPCLDHFVIREVNNQFWKSDFLYPDKVPSGRANQKEAVRAKLIKMFPCLKDITEDEVDAIALGIVTVDNVRTNTEKNLITKKKQKPFEYNSIFFGVEDINSEEGYSYMLTMLAEYINDGSIPKHIVDDAEIIKLDGKGNFDQLIYNNMCGEDRLLILGFSTNKYGNIILRENLGYVANTHDYMISFIWRKNRKQKGNK